MARGSWIRKRRRIKRLSIRRRANRHYFYVICSASEPWNARRVFDYAYEELQVPAERAIIISKWSVINDFRKCPCSLQLLFHILLLLFVVMFETKLVEKSKIKTKNHVFTFFWNKAASQLWPSFKIKRGWDKVSVFIRNNK